MQTFLLKLGIRLLRKVKFKKWTELEDKKFNCIQAVEDSSPNFPDLLAEYLSTALYFNVDFSKVFWKDAMNSFFKVHSVLSTIRKIPITSYKSDKKEKKDSWDYSGRLWFFYCNIVASAYGWSTETIANLSVDDALAYIQEILTSEHLEREFMWSTSEIAYPYNKTTKKSKYSPLSRPYWMIEDGDESKVRKAISIPKSLLPVGNVVNLYEVKKVKSE